ncbi:MAG TPA: hypothetical protein VM008_04775 [Phycisphaerae bacterium]|nr:hypothetical protein [Phycisphaerae bacterium]
MSKRSQEKRRARAKEKAKAARRERGMSPLSRLAGDGTNLECWMHYVAEDARMVNIVAFRPVRDGTFAAAFFLIDYDCIGLKDAFYRFDVMPSDIVASYRERTRMDGSRFIKTNGEEVRKIIAAAVRWTREHAFRVAKDWEKCARIVGGTIDSNSADVSEFGTDGGDLLYVGRRRDLEKLLLEETLEEFMQREDVKCQFIEEVSGFGLDDVDDDDDAGEDEEEGEWSEDEVEEVATAMQKMQKFLLEDATRWVQAQGKTPHPRLKEAVELRTLSALSNLAKGERDGTKDDAALEILNCMEDGEKKKSLQEAYRQLNEYSDALSESAKESELPLGLPESQA